MPLGRTLLTLGLQDWTQPRLASWTLVRLQGVAAVTRRAMGEGRVARHAANSLEGVTNIALLSSPRVRREKSWRWDEAEFGLALGSGLE